MHREIIVSTHNLHNFSYFIQIRVHIIYIHTHGTGTPKNHIVECHVSFRSCPDLFLTTNAGKECWFEKPIGHFALYFGKRNSIMKFSLGLTLILLIAFVISTEAARRSTCSRNYQCRTGKCVKRGDFFCGIGSE